MKVLVTGGAGFIGSHVVDALIVLGHSVVVVDDLSTGKREYVNPAATFYPLDIRDPQLQEIFVEERPQLVNHHAAHVDVRRSVADPIFDAQVNILGSLNLLECCRRNSVMDLVFASSGGAIYGEPLYLPCDEEHPLNPICPYGVSKLAAEKYIYYYGQACGLRYTILRYPNVYGSRQDPSGEGGVTAIFAHRMLRGEQVVINGSGEQQRDFLHVDDVVAANILAHELLEGQIYNLGTGTGTSVNQLFARMKDLTGCDQEPVHGPAKPGETFKIFLDASKARMELGWVPKLGLEEGLRATVNSFRDRL